MLPSSVSLRSLPRVFVSGADASAPIPLPSDEVAKFRKVLRMADGEEIAVLPNDGSVVRCSLQRSSAVPVSIEWPSTEASLRLTVCQALSKGDKLDEIIRACTSLGVAEFVLFPSERSVVQWDAKKTADRLVRLNAIAREAAEVSYRTLLPTLRVCGSLREVLSLVPSVRVLSEVEGLENRLVAGSSVSALAIGPEGGWSRPELDLIGDQALSLGPRVLRTEHAAPAAAAVLLLGS